MDQGRHMEHGTVRGSTSPSAQPARAPTVRHHPGGFLFEVGSPAMSGRRRARRSVAREASGPVLVLTVDSHWFLALKLGMACMLC